jgi:hypothetical protein
MESEEFMRYLLGMAQGKPVCDAVMEIKYLGVLQSVLCASIDTWCAANGENPVKLVEEMLEAMKAVHARDEEDNDDEEV